MEAQRCQHAESDARVGARTPEDEDAGVRYSFGAFELQPRRRALLKNGIPIRIGSRALDILTFLVSRAGTTVAPQELIEHAWPNVSVEYSNLKVNIAQVRRIIDTPAEPSAVIAIPGQGYRFVADVRRTRMAQPAPTTTPLIGRLPPPAELFGRTKDLADVSNALAQSRLVTIVGPGGIGKTAAAVAAASAAAGRFADGVAFIDLTRIGDPLFISNVMAASLGIETFDGDPLSYVAASLSEQERLVVIDNCEHLMPAAAVAIEQLVARVGSAKVLATSREPLRVRGEHVHRLASLPNGKYDPRASDGQAGAAVELFLNRVGRTSSPTLRKAEVPTIAHICRRLDGNPLAIELAAEQAARLSPEQLRDLLDDELRLLQLGPSGSASRHQNLCALLDWSFRLLSTAEMEMLLATSLFEDSFSLDDACAVSDLSASDGLDGLAQLVAKSLLDIEQGGGGPTYSLSNITRAFCLARLEFSRGGPAMRRRHAEHVRANKVANPAASGRSNRNGGAAVGGYSTEEINEAIHDKLLRFELSGVGTNDCLRQVTRLTKVANANDAPVEQSTSEHQVARFTPERWSTASKTLGPDRHLATDGAAAHV